MTNKEHKHNDKKTTRKHKPKITKYEVSRWKPSVYSSLNKRQTLKNLKNNETVRCSANRSEHSYTCYSSKSLHKLKKYWNIRHPERQIRTNDNREIWKALKTNMQNACKNEACWLKQLFIKNNLDQELLSHTFAPYSPRSWNTDPNTWLTSVDIDNVMQQYEEELKNFEFIGPSPIDFDKKKAYGECVWEELCHLNLKNKLKEGIYKIGIVFNTDPHTESGEHWIALFINIKKHYMMYFDSTGAKMPREVGALIKRLEKQFTEMGVGVKVYTNEGFKHQQSDTECGIYVMYFILELAMEAKTPEYFKHKIIPDDDMMRLRKIYFNEQR